MINANKVVRGLFGGLLMAIVIIVATHIGAFSPSEQIQICMLMTIMLAISYDRVSDGIDEMRDYIHQYAADKLGVPP